MNQTNTHNNNIIYAYSKMPREVISCWEIHGHVRSRVRTCPAPWGMSAQEHTFRFCQIFFISGGNYTLITCILYTTMVTYSECEISQSWRTQFSSYGALNLNRAVMPPLPLRPLVVKKPNSSFLCFFIHSVPLFLSLMLTPRCNPSMDIIMFCQCCINKKNGNVVIISLHSECCQLINCYLMVKLKCRYYNICRY